MMLGIAPSSAFAIGSTTDSCKVASAVTLLGNASRVNCTIRNSYSYPIDVWAMVSSLPEGIDSMGLAGGAQYPVVAGGGFTSPIAGTWQPGETKVLSLDVMLNGKRNNVAISIYLESGAKGAATGSAYLMDSPVVMQVDSGVAIPQNVSGSKTFVTSGKKAGTIKSFTLRFSASSASSIRIYETYQTMWWGLQLMPVAEVSGSQTSYSASGAPSTNGYAIIAVDASGKESVPVKVVFSN